MNKSIIYCGFVGFFSLLSPIILQALTVNFDGILVVSPPECKINGGTIADVSFGDVHETLIDGRYYKRLPIDYTLDCSEANGQPLKMTMSWNDITINNQNVIATNKPSLGIAIYHGETQLSNGSVVNFTYGSDKPSLYAVPVKPTGIVLTDGGAFNGTLNLVVDYQ